MKNIQTRQIEWFLNFINMDLAKVTSRRKDESIQDMEKIFGQRLHPDLNSFDRTTSSLVAVEMKVAKREETLQRLQQNLKTFFIDGVLQRYEELKLHNIEGWHNLSSSQIADLRNMAKLSVEGDILVRIKIEPEMIRRDKMDASSSKIQWLGNTLGKSPLEVISITRGNDESFLVSFIELLHGISLSSFNRCKDEKCGKWFFQKTKRIRKYCSDQCRSKINIREKRIFQKEKNRVRTIRIGNKTRLDKVGPEQVEKPSMRAIRLRKGTHEKKEE